MDSVISGKIGIRNLLYESYYKEKGPMKQKAAYSAYAVLTVVLLLCGYLFEKPFGERRLWLGLLTLLYLLCLVGHFVVKKVQLQGGVLLTLVFVLVGLEFTSKYAVNYFYHSLYLLLLLLIIFRCSRHRVLPYSILLSLCSFIKFGELLLIQPSAGNIAMSTFFAVTQLLLILVFSLYREFREESIRNKELYEELLITNLQLKQYSEELKHLTKLQERSNIARDLHDTLGHELTGLIMQMEMVTRLLDQDPQKGRSILEEAKSTARGSLTQVRTIVNTLKSDEEMSWNQTGMKELAEHFSSMTGVRITCENTGDGPASPAIGLALYRLVQEALTNAVRHGKATKVGIRIGYEQEGVRFEIEDNGRGCTELIYGNGIKGMFERISALHGNLTMDGTKGFRLTGYIPYS